MLQGRRALVALAAVGLSLAAAGVAQAAPGDVDTSFGQGGIATIDLKHNAFANALLVQPDGRIVVAGTAISTFGTTTDAVTARFTQQGAPDTSYGPQGNGASQADFGQNETGYGAALQPDGKIVVAGDSASASSGFSQAMVTRFNANGPVDTTFGAQGEGLFNFPSPGIQTFGRAMALQADGQIVVAGYEVDNNNFYPTLFRFNNPAGTADTSFQNDGELALGYSVNTLAAVALKPNGEIESVGEHTASIGAPGDFFLFGLTGDAPKQGPLDLGGDEAATAVAVQPDGKVLVAGYTNLKGTFDFVVLRLNSDHSLDASFGTGGKEIVDLGGSDTAKAIVLQPDGKIVVAGTTTSGGASQIGVVRLLANGQPDTSFGHNGASVIGFGTAKMQGNAVGLESNGDVVVGGVVTPAGGSQKNLLVVRLHGDSSGNSGSGSGGSGSGGGGPSPGATGAPTLSGVSASKTTFHRASFLPKLNPTARTKGTLISATVSAAAQLTLTFTQPALGRLTHGHCSPPNKHNRGAGHCTRHITKGTITFQAKAGANTIAFGARLTPTKKLAPGTYSLTITASAGGATSAPTAITLTIKH